MKDKKKEEITNNIVDEIYDSGLTEKEQNFVLFYLDSHNIIQSYMKAYDAPRTTALKRGYEVYHKEKIQNELKRLKKIMMISMDLDVTRYVETLDKAANANIGDYITFKEEEVPILDKEGLPIINPDTGEPMTKKVNKMHLADSDTVDLTVVQEIKQGKDGVSIKLLDKYKALDSLKEFFDWKNKEEKDIEVSNSFMDALKESSVVWDKDDIDKDLEDMEKADG